VHRRTNELRKQADDAVNALECELRAQLPCVPRRVRQMTLAQFKHSYGASAPHALLSDLASRSHGQISSEPPAPLTPAGPTSSEPCATPAHTVSRVANPSSQRSSRRAGLRQALPGPPPAANASLENDAGPAASAKKRKAQSQRTSANPKTPKTPGTITPEPGRSQRMPTRGEMVLSENGSPLGTYEESEGNEEAEPVAALPQSVQLAQGGSLRVVTEDGKAVEFPSDGNGIDGENDDYSSAIGFLRSIQTGVSGLLSKLAGASNGAG